MHRKDWKTPNASRLMLFRPLERKGPFDFWRCWTSYGIEPRKSNVISYLYFSWSSSSEGSKRVQFPSCGETSRTLMSASYAFRACSSNTWRAMCVVYSLVSEKLCTKLAKCLLDKFLGSKLHVVLQYSKGAVCIPAGKIYPKLQKCLSVFWLYRGTVLACGWTVRSRWAQHGQGIVRRISTLSLKYVLRFKDSFSI